MAQWGLAVLCVVSASLLGSLIVARDGLYDYPIKHSNWRLLMTRNVVIEVRTRLQKNSVTVLNVMEVIWRVVSDQHRCFSWFESERSSEQAVTQRSGRHGG